MTDFSERLASLSPEQRALFELRRKQKGLSQAQNQGIPRRKPAPHYPLSFDQMRLWFLYQLAPNNSAYNITGGVELTGPLNVEVLERSLNEIIRRHEILRTTFANLDEQPVQVIAPRLSIKIRLVDLSDLPPQEQAVAMPRVATEHAQVPFDLINGPLIRASLLRLAADRHILITTMHHIVTDRWSYTLFEQELAILYHAFSNRLPSPLPELPIQFADFAIWQQQWMQSEKMQVQLDFWKRQLADLPPVHGLPLDRPRPTVVSFRGARQEVVLSPAAVAGVRGISRQSGATIFITLLTMFKVLMARQSGQTDIVVGTPIANRGRPELERLIGFFLNTLIFRSDLSRNPTFREYLAQVREIASQAYAHQDVPFERLVAELRPERDTSRNPLYQISFLFLDFEDPQEISELPGLKVKTIDVDTEDSRFDLTFALWSDPEKIYGSFEYSTDIFEPQTIAAFAEHFKLLVESIAADPDQRVFDIPCLTDDEQRRLLHDWNTSAADYPEDRPVHELIAEQAARTPEAVAVLYADRSLSYGELNRRANQLAHQLHALGVGRESRVGVYLQRSPDLLVALLGVLKAGAAYVPLDPSYPAARLQFMLHDAEIGVLLTQQTLLETLSDYAGSSLCLDRDWPQIARQPADDPASAVQPEQIAYIIYTSGSTGQPKGVQIPQRALSNFLHAMRREPGISADDTLLAVTTIAFDIAGLELFLPLLAGARVVLLSRDDAADGARLAQLIDTSGATIMQATPATWRMLLTAGWQGSARLKALCGGEALSWDLARDLLGHVDQLWNLYGPTETTIWSAATRVQAEDGRVSLGQPIANTRLYVLDHQQRLLPVGVPGELYIGGDGLARGYLKRPDLTAERFVPDPFSATGYPQGGARLYRTGDLVRYRHDGTIEFFGRIDQQIKLRGYRIELGEIEAVLRQQPEVRDAAVLVREDRPGDQRLVAYLVENQEPRTTQQTEDSGSTSSSSPVPETAMVDGAGSQKGKERTAELLANALRARLPEYMIPSAFVLLDALPLTPNGKLDRKALPAPDRSHSSGDGSFVPPRTPAEEMIAGVWSATLGVERVGVHDNFFALGGHSLMATQVVSRLKQVMNLDLPLRLLFEAPTVAAFATRLAAQQADNSIPLRAVSRDGAPLPLSFAQQRMWFLDRLQPNSAAYNLLTVARLRGTVDLQAVQRSLTAISARHESLRTSFAEQRGEPVQIIHPVADVPLPLISLRDQPAEQQQSTLMQIVRAEAERPFDLQQSPLLRAQIVQIDPAEHVLLLTVHHIVSDGWSQGVLLRELAALYQGFVADVPRPEESLPPLDLPTDYPRPPVMTSRGAQVTVQLPAALSQKLHQLSQRLGSTLFMTLLAAWQTLLHRYSGQTDIAVGTPIAGRMRPELEGLIGFFVNTLVLRADLSRPLSFMELVAQVRGTALEAYAHQDLPFELIVERLQPQRDLSRAPLFQVMFALQNMPYAAIDLPDLLLEPIEVESSTTQFDLSLTLVEIDGALQGQVQYSTDLFDAATIERLIDHYQVLLRAVVADPEQPVMALPLLTEPELAQLAAWDAPTAAVPQRWVHEQFEAQAARSPEAIALLWGEQQLSYRELNARANQLAQHLRSLGAGPEVRVGLCLDRSPELIVGLLAILKAGAAYVPLDPEYPQERLAFLLQDAGLSLVVTQEALAERLVAPALRVLCLDRDHAAIAAEPEQNPGLTLPPDTLAYVIYTSGSTGQPKGVLVEHQQLANALFASQAAIGFTCSDRIPSIASFSFDIALFELFCPLLAGGSVLLTNRQQILDLPGFARTLESCTILHAVPGLMRQIVAFVRDHDRRERYGALRQVLVGGEVVPPDLLAEIRDAFPAAQITILYGPTEATIICTTHRLAAGAIPNKHLIGRPMHNSTLRLYDAHGQRVPIGVPGELYIGGAGVARGYWRRDELTAEKFVMLDGQRWYRSGDKVRLLPDGTLEFLGRIDQQVKLRGYRIELGEIEAVLRQHPAVEEAVVVAREDTSSTSGPPDRRLVAYVTEAQTNKGEQEQAEPSAHQALIAELRDLLAARLPAYMIPAQIVVLPALPLLPSGKINRRALPQPEAEQREFVAPRTPTETALAEIWAELLSLERVSVLDDFFSLGGHSLLATRVIARIREQFHVELAARSFFEHPTVAGLAQQIEAAQWSDAGAAEIDDEEEWEI